MIKIKRPACPNERVLQSDYKNPSNKAALIAACYAKCMYCESKVTQVYWGDVEHIKPKSTFPELEFEWSNLGFVCARCNGQKSDKWSEETPLIDPFVDDPDEHLAAVGPVVFHRNGSERGEYTCLTLDLNRVELFESRRERIKQLVDLIDKIKRTNSSELSRLVRYQLQDELDDDKEYAMVSRAAVSQILDDQSTSLS